MSALPKAEHNQAFLTGGGEMGALLRVHDWSTSPLSHPSTWPQALRTAVSLMLGAAQPIYVAWGPELTSLYNDGYLAIVGTKHPCIGLPFFELWAEIEEQFRPIVEKTLAGEAQHFADLPISLAGRPGVPVGYFTFSYTPLRDEDGKIAGIFVAATETTERALAERRRETLLQLDDRLRDVADTADLSFAASELLGVALGAARVGYGAVNADAGTIAIERNWYAPGFNDLAGVHRFADYGSYIVELRRGEAVANTDVETDPRTSASAGAFQALGIRAHLDMPVVEGGCTVGQMFVHSATPRIWADEEVAFVREFAERIRAAIARRTAEQELRESEARFRALATVGSASVYRMSPDWCELRRLDGAGFIADAKEPTAEWIEAYVPSDEQPRVLGAIERAIRTKGVFELEYRVWRADGTIGWTFSRAIPLFDNAGEIVEWFGADSDVTARVHADQAFTRLFEASPAPLLILKPDAPRFTIAEVNDAYLAATKRQRGDLLGSGIFEAFPDNPGDPTIKGVSTLRASLERVLATRQSDTLPSLKYDVAAPDGSFEERWWSSINSAVVSEDGQVEAIIHNANDVTEERRAAAALRASEAVARVDAQRVQLALSAGAIIGTWFWDIPTDCFKADEPFACAFGLDSVRCREGIPLADIFATVHPDDKAGLAEAIEAATIKGGAYARQYRVRRADGRYYWIEANGRVDHGPDGTPLSFPGVLIDLEGRRAVEAERDRAIAVSRALNETLEQRVAERTAQLEAAHEQLRQSQKMEAMGSLTGGVAHDFNNLLTPIVGSLDMLQRKGVGGEREQRLIAGAIQSADRAKTLVQRLLAFARRQPLQTTGVDLAALVRGMADLVSSTTGPQIKIVVDAADGLPPAKADPNQLEMALLNLAVNARDAMPEGGTLRILVDAETVGRQHRANVTHGRYLKLSVADTGEGMDEETLKRAVEPFFSTKGVGKGTGLGLSMVHGLASQLGGALTINSTPGVGTNVELWLPQCAEPPGVAGSAAHMSPIPKAAGTVLLVDDEDHVRFSTADMLIELGYAVVEAASAEEALRLVDRGLRPDLLVTDHLMPVMPGTELARALQGSHPNMQVLIISGYAEAEGIAPDLPRLTKPFRYADLAASLADLPTPPSPRGKQGAESVDPL
ncbi:PAS domain-containing protein [Caulobacter sp. DWR1-3-2b1]|uniref:PAS domain-containing protein n=1 Tax=Caulobacter sp. DWR1-3-2b1 TaxID=2804670 RepID=UPI003CE8FA20